MRTELGRIQKATFGYGGYQGAMIGARFLLGGGSWSVGDFWGAWAMEPSDTAEWTNESRIVSLGQVVMRLRDILTAAKVDTVDLLVGVPIEATFDGVTLKSWRILTEVL